MTKRLVPILLVVAAIVVVHITIVRPWFVRWGATDHELSTVWAGDELSPNADTVTTRAVTVDASAEYVWPWILQLGQDRAGWYSYRLLENLVGSRMPRVHRVVAAFQHRDVGDKVWMYPADRLGGVGHAVVARVAPGRALVLATMPIGAGAITTEATLAFLLEPIDDSHTRLIMRGRGPTSSSVGWRLLDRGVFQPIHFIMERRMMATIKALAEGHDPDETGDIVQALLWIVIGLSCGLALVATALAVNWQRAPLALAAGATALAVATLSQPPVLVTALLAAGVAGMLGPFPHLRASRHGT
jgi:hypothetical protein